MRLLALPRMYFLNLMSTRDDFKFLEEHQVISINCTESNGNRTKGVFVNAPFNVQQHKNLLVLGFDDLEDEHEVELCGGWQTLFNNEHARKIIDFVTRDKGFINKTFVVHCLAGICRSGAVVDSLNYFFNTTFIEGKLIRSIDYEWTSEHNKQILPNTLVRKIMFEELEKYRDRVNV